MVRRYIVSSIMRMLHRNIFSKAAHDNELTYIHIKTRSVQLLLWSTDDDSIRRFEFPQGWDKMVQLQD